jgi:organic radical activating enzyme
MRRGDLSRGCGSCADEEPEASEAPYRRQFDDLDATAAWPSMIGFYLSNRCNLQCVQCNGESSSAIRSLREKRPPLTGVYGEQFFEDLAAFLPHLRRAVIAGGEPLLAPETLRLADMLIEHAPDVRCTLVTNGTVWNDRVEHILQRLNCSVVVSIDAATAETFEAIRVGASFPRVLDHLEHFVSATTARGTVTSINHCLMPQNHREFPDLLLFAEDLGLAVDVSVVREPASHSLAALPADDLAAVVAGLEARDRELRDRLELNLRTWLTELERLRSWARAASAAGGRLLGRSPHRILMFERRGYGQHDAEAARGRLLELGNGSPVHELRIRPGDVVTEVPAGLAQQFGPAARGLAGSSVLSVQQVLVERLGPMLSWDVVHEDADRSDAVGRFTAHDVHVSMCAERDGDGWASHVTMLLVVVGRDSHPTASGDAQMNG